MTQNKDRMALGIILITLGFFGIIVSLASSTMLGFFMWPMGSMMRGWNDGEQKVVNGTVKKIEWVEIELQVNGEEIEVHGPSWFWQRIEIKEGDAVIVKGVFVSMMEPGEGWHEGLIPFELKVNDKTYGTASARIPVWM